MGEERMWKESCITENFAKKKKKLFLQTFDYYIEMCQAAQPSSKKYIFNSKNKIPHTLNT